MAYIETNELRGAALDWAVAKIEYTMPAYAYWKGTKTYVYMNRAMMNQGFTYSPSTDWAMAAPIIVREKISIISCSPEWVDGVMVPVWAAEHGGCHSSVDDDEFGDSYYEIIAGCCSHADSPLVAAMRCFCRAHYGVGLEIPDELLASN